jgi:hypothetical protein
MIMENDEGPWVSKRTAHRPEGLLRAPPSVQSGGGGERYTPQVGVSPQLLKVVGLDDRQLTELVPLYRPTGKQASMWTTHTHHHHHHTTNDTSQPASQRPES